MGRLSYIPFARLILQAVCLVCIPLSGFAEETLKDSFLAQYYENLGDRFYEYRELSAHLHNSQESYQNALKISTKPGRIYWKLSRGYWSLGENSHLTAEKKVWFQKAIDYSRKSIELDSNSPEAHLWNALATGKYMIVKGVLKTLDLKDRVKTELETTLKLDKKNTNAYLGLATWYFNIPPLLGGDMNYALLLINRSISLAPQNPRPLLIKAEFLLASGRVEEGKKLLKKIISMKITAPVGNAIISKATAQVLLTKE